MEVGEDGYQEGPFSTRGLSLAEANSIEEVGAWLNSENSAVHQVLQEGDTNIISVNSNIVISLLLSYNFMSIKSYNI